jgi:hypothetical protein
VSVPLAIDPGPPGLVRVAARPEADRAALLAALEEPLS